MNLILIEGHPAIKGNPYLIDEPCYGLPVGSKINRVGSGKNTGSTRTSLFFAPVTYQGSLFIEGEKFYAFWLTAHKGEDVFIVYGDTGSELYVPCYDKHGKECGTMFYKPTFNIVS